MKFKIDYRWDNVGDHQDRYAHLDGKVIEVNSAKEADGIISDFVAKAEEGVSDAELWGSDTCVKSCAYLLDDNGEMTDTRLSDLV